MKQTLISLFLIAAIAHPIISQNNENQGVPPCIRNAFRKEFKRIQLIEESKPIRFLKNEKEPEKLQGHSSYMILPQNKEEYELVFKDCDCSDALTYSQKIETEIKGAKKQYAPNGKKRRLAVSNSGRKNFEDFLKVTEDRIISVIGHNEAGDFKFLNGDSTRLTILTDICRDNGKFCIFLSCNSQEYTPNGINSAVSFRDAINILAGIEKFIQKNQNAVSAEALSQEIEKIAVFEKRKAKVWAIVVDPRAVTVEGAGVLALYVMYESKE